MKWPLLFVLPLIFLGCSKSESMDPKLQALIDAHDGQTTWFECNDVGFLEEHNIWRSPQHHAVRLIKNDANVPTRCNVSDISIRVKETVATGTLSGDVR